MIKVTDIIMEQVMQATFDARITPTNHRAGQELIRQRRTS